MVIGKIINIPRITVKRLKDVYPDEIHLKTNHESETQQDGMIQLLITLLILLNRC